MGEREDGRVPEEYARDYWAWVERELDQDWGEPLGEVSAAGTVTD